MPEDVFPHFPLPFKKMQMRNVFLCVWPNLFLLPALRPIFKCFSLKLSQQWKLPSKSLDVNPKVNTALDWTPWLMLTRKCLNFFPQLFIQRAHYQMVDSSLFSFSTMFHSLLISIWGIMMIFLLSMHEVGMRLVCIHIAV